MPKTGFQVPILLLVFNRPDYLAKMLDKLRQLRPTKLYISGDGPRSGRNDDRLACSEVKRVAQTVDWPCDVKTQFSSSNLGCKRGVNRGITWFFDQVEAGIILEDDCLPDLSFFPFCQDLLERYKDDERVAQIGGANFLGGVDLKGEDYCFSIYPHCWGWATWRRAWRHYDVEMKAWPAKGRSLIVRIFSNRQSASYWSDLMDATFKGKIDTWDYQWIYACWQQRQLCVVPAINLITNIGFDGRATHTKLSFSPLANQAVGQVRFPLHHPAGVAPNLSLDKRLQSEIYERNKYIKLLTGFKKYLHRIMGSDDRMMR